MTDFPKNTSATRFRQEALKIFFTLAKEIAKEMAENALEIRRKLKKNLVIVQWLLRTSAAREYNVRSLLKGKI